MMVLFRLNFACFHLKIQERIQQNDADRTILLMLQMTNGFRRKRIYLPLSAVSIWRALEKCWSVAERFECLVCFHEMCTYRDIFKLHGCPTEVERTDLNRVEGVKLLLLVVLFGRPTIL